MATALDDKFTPDNIALLLSEMWTLHKSEGFATYLAEIFGKAVAVHTHFDCIYISQAEEGDIPNAILRSAAKWWQVDDSGFNNIGRPDMSEPDAPENVRGWFKPTMTGEFDIQCTEICGIGHALMPARIFIETREDHASWVMSQTPATAALTVPTTQTGGMP